MLKIFFLIFNFFIIGVTMPVAMDEIEGSINFKTEHNSFLWRTECSVEINCGQDRIWQLWTDVENWRQWDHDVEYSSLEGSFRDDEKGILKPTQGPRSEFTMLDVKEQECFTTRSSLPLCTSMDFIHQMERVGTKLTVKHIVIISGALTPLFSRVIGKGVARGLPSAMTRLALLAEGRLPPQNK